MAVLPPAPGDDRAPRAVDDAPSIADIRDLFRRLDLSVDEAWTAYAVVGGLASALEVDAWLHEALVAGTAERRLLHHALWEVELDRS